jgi:hypothetical protein
MQWLQIGSTVHRQPVGRHFRDLRIALAIEHVDEPTLDGELSIEREQKRQARRSLWVDVLFSARLIPAPPKRIVSVLRATFGLAERSRRRVMQKLAKRAVAEQVVVARVEDELVPQVVHDLRGHRDVLLTALQIRQKELTKRVAGQLAILLRQMWVFRAQLVIQAGWQFEVADEFDAAGVPQLHQYDQQPEAKHKCEKDRDRCHTPP